MGTAGRAPTSGNYGAERIPLVGADERVAALERAKQQAHGVEVALRVGDVDKGFTDGLRRDGRTRFERAAYGAELFQPPVDGGFGVAERLRDGLEERLIGQVEIAEA